MNRAGDVASGGTVLRRCIGDPEMHLVGPDLRAPPSNGREVEALDVVCGVARFQCDAASIAQALHQDVAQGQRRGTAEQAENGVRVRLPAAAPPDMRTPRPEKISGRGLTSGDEDGLAHNS